MNYRYEGKQKTLALGVYPAVSLAKAASGATTRANCWLTRSTRPKLRATTSKQKRSSRQTRLRLSRAHGLPRRQQIARRARMARSRRGLKRICSRPSARCRYRQSARVTCWRQCRRWRRAAQSTLRIEQRKPACSRRLPSNPRFQILQTSETNNLIFEVQHGRKTVD